MSILSPVGDNFGPATTDAQIKVLEEDKELLFNQLHVVQEVLERLHHGAQSTDGQNSAGGITLYWVDDRLPELMAENLRCTTLLETQREVHRLETQHALASELGQILIEGTTSPTALLAVPARLLKVWRQERKQVPTRELGGKSFDKVIAAYHEGGLAAVERLLTSVSASPTVQANALTAVARSLMHREPTKAAEIARRAYGIEPRPFRLKWLAFRLHEAGELLEAESMLEVLPPDVHFSDSESNQASRLRSEARQLRMRDAKQKCSFAERRAEVERQIASLTAALIQARDEQASLAVQRQGEVESLHLTLAQREQEQSALRARSEALQTDVAALTQARDEQTALAVQRLKQLNESNEQVQSRQSAETKLAARQQCMQEDLAKAEAQLDLIKDLLLREPRL